MRPPFDHAWIDGFDRRLAQRRRMIRALGIAVPRRPDPRTHEELRQTLITCAICGHDRACAAWLADHPEADNPPPFCENLTRFQLLMEALSAHRPGAS